MEEESEGEESCLRFLGLAMVGFLLAAECVSHEMRNGGVKRVKEVE
jgi:hypothetical protein